MRNAKFLVLLTLLPTTAKSQESSMACPNFRLDQAGRSMSRLPVYNQGSLDTCYSYTAAQLIDAYRFSNGDNSSEAKPSSPLGLAIAYSALRREGNQPRPRNGINGGDFVWTINTARSMQPGICNDDAVNRHFTTQPQTAQTLSVLSKLRDRNETALKTRDPAQARVVAEALRQFLLAKGYTEAMIRNLGDLTRVMNTETAPQFFHKLVAETCRGREIDLREVPAPTELHVHQGGPRGNSRESDFGLLLRRMFSSANPQPVGIAYCADFLQNGSVVRNLEANPSTERPGSTAGCNLEHASVIVGSRERNGSCEFLIRNTFGNDCSGYDSRWQCENGQIWVRESALIRNTNKASWIGGPTVR